MNCSCLTHALADLALEEGPDLHDSLLEKQEKLKSLHRACHFTCQASCIALLTAYYLVNYISFHKKLLTNLHGCPARHGVPWVQVLYQLSEAVSLHKGDGQRTAQNHEGHTLGDLRLSRIRVP